MEQVRYDYLVSRNVNNTLPGKKLTYAHQQIPQMQNEELNVDHHKLGNQQPSNNDEILITSQ